MALGQWVQLAPHASRSNGTLTSGARTIPQGLTGVDVRIDCCTGTATPFTGFSPAFSQPTMTITLVTYFSWDGGASFPESASTSAVGTASGFTDRHGNPIVGPSFTRELPCNAVLAGIPDCNTPGTGHPNFYKADLIIAGGPIDVGLSLREF